MTKKMLIDGSHPEETRVVLVDDQRLEDFDFESTTKKQLKGNIYLAKVTRVEPSLQAAFVDYGGNRHGFLAFSEIHPDYFQIPQADRDLLTEQRAANEAEPGDGNGSSEEGDGDGGEAGAEAVATDPDEETAEVIDEQQRKRSRLLRSYKIQEVIKRRQILLVQVVKEERGNKGAALTTYLSLAGRYCVLMPNTARGGGISRKIASPGDRSRLKTIARDLDVPDGMGLIIRTAGQERNKSEIRRDYEYLLRLWNDIRELTLKSVAPCVIYEEGALVQRAVRDLYGRDVEEILVDGEEAYRTARKIMSMLMPSRARRVKLYKGDVPLFHAHAVETHLDLMHSPTVHLRSGGSIVIHSTEALTAIDVNSGRSTRERNIEETALKTNLEAADEVARQLRLRDLAGLVVVDFIDMNEGRNQRAVERRMRDALKSDRARVQLGRISAFGLLELSRQRLRPSFQELSSQPCPTCGGLGVVRSTESAALQALRAMEVEGIKGTTAVLGAILPQSVALYVLNQKRDRLVALEQRYAMRIDIRVDEEMIAGDFEMECDERRVTAETAGETEAAGREAPPAREEAASQDDDGSRKKRRRRRRKKRPEDGAESERMQVAARDSASPEEEDEAPAPAEAEAEVEQAKPGGEDGDAEPSRKRRRRPRKPKTEAPAPAAAESAADAPAPHEMEQPALSGQILEFSLEGPIGPAADRPSEALATGAAGPEAAAADNAPTAETTVAAEMQAGMSEAPETGAEAAAPPEVPVPEADPEAPSAQEAEPEGVLEPPEAALEPVVATGTPDEEDEMVEPSLPGAVDGDGRHDGEVEREVPPAATAAGNGRDRDAAADGSSSDEDDPARDAEEMDEAGPKGPPRRGWWNRFVRRDEE